MVGITPSKVILHLFPLIHLASIFMAPLDQVSKAGELCGAFLKVPPVIIQFIDGDVPQQKTIQPLATPMRSWKPPCGVLWRTIA